MLTAKVPSGIAQIAHGMDFPNQWFTKYLNTEPIPPPIKTDITFNIKLMLQNKKDISKQLLLMEN